MIKTDFLQGITFKDDDPKVFPPVNTDSFEFPNVSLYIGEPRSVSFCNYFIIIYK